MPQAKKPDTPSPSRRAFLTGAAPVAAALVLAGGAAAAEAAVAPVITSVTPAAPAVVDPIFALIEQHRAALHEEKRTHDIFEKIADEHPYEDDDNRGVVVREGSWKPFVVWNEKGLVHYAPKDLDEAGKAAWIKDKTKELRRNKRAYARRNKNPQRDAAYKAWNEAGIAVDGLSKQIIETSPTTVAGVAAVLAHWSKVMDEDEHDRDFISTGEFLEKLAKGVKALG
jgi:hypothetical protein